MEPEVLAAIVSGSGALAVAAITIIVNAVLENKRGKRQAADAAAQRAELAEARNEDAEHQRLERRYEDRLRFLIEFIEEADRLMAKALETEYKQQNRAGYDGPPSHYLDGPELDPELAALRAALSRLDLVAGPECRKAAAILEKRVSTYVWDWKNYDDVHDARAAFLESSRPDLGLPELGAKDGQVSVNAAKPD